MNIEELIPDSGKQTAIHAANVAMKKPEIIPEILDLAFWNKYQYSTRAANAIEIIDSKMPGLIKPFYSKIINGFTNYKTDGVKRCFLKIFTRHTDIKNEQLLCILLNFCFDALSSSSETVAVKVYSLMILYEISKKEPDLKNELIFAIKDQLPKNSAAFRSIGNKMLKKLYK